MIHLNGGRGWKMSSGTQISTNLEKKVSRVSTKVVIVNNNDYLICLFKITLLSNISTWKFYV